MNIPKKIHLTCKNKNNIDNIIWKKCLEKYRLIYPDYEIIIYDNEDIYNIVHKYYPEYLYKIKKIKIGAILADIFRYLILYLEGGIYSDFDCEPLKKIDELLDSDFKYYHGDKNRDNNFWIYGYDKQIINKEWDFKKNICDNYKLINNGNNSIKMKYLGHNLSNNSIKWDFTINNPIQMKCFGHKMGNISTILGYEFHSDYVNSNLTNNPKWCYKNVGICQWFMITEPKQDIYIKMFNNIMTNIDSIINISITTNYHYTVINTTGPLAFTKVVINNLTNKIKILPCDFFCCGSGDGPTYEPVPLTNNSYIKHHYTASWV